MSEPVTPWITLTEVKEDLKIGADDNTFDASLQRIIDGVCRAIEDYCGRTFVAQTETALKLDGDGSVILLLRFPVISITSIDNDGTAVTLSQYALYRDVGKVQLTDGTSWSTTPQGVTITYRHGWELANVPASVKSAAMFWTIKRFLDLKDSRIGVTSVSLGDQTIGILQKMPEEVRQMIDPYRSMACFA